VAPQKPPAELPPPLLDLAQLWAPALSARRIAFRLEVPAGCTLMADRRQLEQILINLVNNAADATEGGGSITISCTKAGPGGGEWEVSVSDTGHGIPAEAIGSVFRPMFTTKPEGKGTGLGLAICRAIVRAHGGEIGIESEPERGTTVRFTLPDEPREKPLANRPLRGLDAGAAAADLHRRQA
jgi:signal transduction histidine kinase